MARPLKLCLITLGGTTQSAIVATTKKRMVELIDENWGGGTSLHWLNGYGSIHEDGPWFDRFAPMGEGIWVNHGREYGEFDILNWERLV